MVTVIHIKDAPPGWKTNPKYQYIGRGSKWGNEYSHLARSKAKHRVQTRDDAVELFERHQLPELLPHLHELEGVKYLVCFCHPQRCHGDVIAKVLNSD